MLFILILFNNYIIRKVIIILSIVKSSDLLPNFKN